MLSISDRKQLENKGISEELFGDLLDRFQRGFPPIPAEKPALISAGIFRLTPPDMEWYVRYFEENKTGKSLLKFVPASGAATRMFKSLYEQKISVLNGQGVEENNSLKELFTHLPEFAFFPLLKKGLNKKGIAWSDPHCSPEILDMILEEEGLNYGNLPKGLILFHSYPEGARTAAEEHLVEGSFYAADTRGKVRLHFTVSPEHLSLFRQLMGEKIPLYRQRFGLDYEVDFSVQAACTDTPAVGEDNSPLREGNGELVFRPGGHGALLHNLNQNPADVLFIKNIDNVCHERLLALTSDYKKALAGILLSLREKIFYYLRKMEEASGLELEFLSEIGHFIEKELSVIPPEKGLPSDKDEKMAYFRKKLHRPLRVCGMVKNVGEPGGGPFWVRNPDGSLSLQIAESSQFDMEDPVSRKVFEASSHFNPVDLVCSTIDYKGRAFELNRFRDPDTGFVSAKTKNGTLLKALELPGLWNGGMADWNTVFVEVPIETFNPVKTIFDLLRSEHLPA